MLFWKLRIKGHLKYLYYDNQVSVDLNEKYTK